jgi:isoleucyl-tRNA synthetase
MGDWNISRKRYFGLPLPFYPCECGHLNVLGSRAELEKRAVSGLDQLEELHRPWIDAVPIRCAECNAEVRRVPEVGDVWLDAGIVPFSTLGWRNDEWIPGGYATGASKGLSGADLPDHAYWEKWFPADWVTEMREQIRLWFYAQLFMSVALDGRAPFERVLGHEDVRDEHGHEMHNSKGNTIEAHEAVEQMGADVMRWMYCEQAPTQSLRFGYTPAADIKRRLLTLWNSASFLVTYANIEGWRPRWEDVAGGPTGELRPLDRWLVARTQKFVADTGDAFDRYWTRDVVRGFDAFVDDVSNWYIRRSRRRFYSLEEPAAFATLWYALVQAVRAIAPVMPFLAEHLWRNLTASAEGAPDSVHLAGWPDPAEWDAKLVGEVAEVRSVVELGRQARSASGMKLRQPLRRMVVQGASASQRHEDEIREELRVKEVEFGPVEAMEIRVKPNLPLLGPKLGKELGAVRQALAAGRFEQLDDGGVRVDGHVLAADEVLVERVGREGWALAESDGLTVALELALDEELEREGEVYDLIHRVNSMRKDAGLELTDRIRITLPRAQDSLAKEYSDWIAGETLAVAVEAGDVDEPRIEKA